VIYLRDGINQEETKMDNKKEYFGKVHPALKKELGAHGDHATGMAGSDKGVAVSFNRPKDVNALRKQMAQHGYKNVTQMHDTTGKHKHVYHFQESNENPVDSYMDNKKVSFKNFVTGYEEGRDEYIQYRNMRRRHGALGEAKKVECPECKGEGCDHCDNKGYHLVKEALNVGQRRRRAIQMRRMKGKIRIGQQRAKMRVANKERLIKRARKAARTAIMKKLTKGKGKDQLDYSRRQSIEKRIDKMKGKVDQLARKLFPQIRKKEMTKRQQKGDK